METKKGLPCVTADNDLLAGCHRLVKRGGGFASARQKIFFLKKKTDDGIWEIFREAVAKAAGPDDRLFIQGVRQPDKNRTFYYGFLLDEAGVRVRLEISRSWQPFSPAPIAYDRKKYWRSSRFYSREINAGLREKNLELVQGEIKTMVFGR